MNVAPAVPVPSVPHPGTLMLVTSYRCSLRCTYCPTRKADDDMAVETAHAVVDRFLLGVDAAPGDPDPAGFRQVRFFGAEPAMAFHVVRATIERIRKRRPELHARLVYRMTTNGTLLDDDLFAFVEAEPRFELTVSMDGPPEVQGAHRVPSKPKDLAGIVAAEAGDPSSAWFPLVRDRLFALSRPVCVNMTIAPDQARRAGANFVWLYKQGFRKFNFLPGYYIAWRDDQLDDLRRGFADVREAVTRLWAAGAPLTIKNLFQHAAVTFYNTGIVIDTDGALYNHNFFLTRTGAPLKARMRIGHVNDRAAPLAPFDRDDYGELIAGVIPEGIRDCTRRADAELTRFVQDLWPAYRAARGGASAAPPPPAGPRSDVVLAAAV